MSQYHYKTADGEPEGPVHLDDMRALVSDGMLQKETLVSKAGGPWRKLNECFELAPSRHAAAMSHPAFQAANKKEGGNPPGFVLCVVLTLLVWPIGLVGAIYFLCDPKHRNAGLAMFGITCASALLAWTVMRMFYGF